MWGAFSPPSSVAAFGGIARIRSTDYELAPLSLADLPIRRSRSHRLPPPTAIERPTSAQPAADTSTESSQDKARMLENLRADFRIKEEPDLLALCEAG